MTSHLSRRLAFAFTLPALVAIAPFVAACLYILRFSLSGEQGVIEGFSLTPYYELLTPYFGRSVWITLKLSLIATSVVIVLAVPLALVLVTLQSNLARRLLTVTILLPLILNLLVQAYGWVLLLGPSGVINSTLIALGLTDRPVRLMFNETGVLLGLIQTSLPLAVFPIASSVRSISSEYLEAASSLGATHWRSFRDITLPLLRPGLVAAASIVFAFNASAFAIPLLLGGRRVQMVGLAVRDMISPLFNWSGAAAGGMVLILLTIFVLFASNYLVRKTTARIGT
ncbi:MAG: ABC transporter permease [Rhizobiaceae bacterium]|jgi:putative spermidine/putrescine transport system permease protein|nr:ABC transporter permease [Rhizobiaceae bacterium]